MAWGGNGRGEFREKGRGGKGGSIPHRDFNFIADSINPVWIWECMFN